MDKATSLKGILDMAQEVGTGLLDCGLLDAEDKCQEEYLWLVGLLGLSSGLVWCIVVSHGCCLPASTSSLAVVFHGSIQLSHAHLYAGIA